VIGAPLTRAGARCSGFAKANGIDDSKITWETISIQLQDQHIRRRASSTDRELRHDVPAQSQLLGVDSQ